MARKIKKSLNLITNYFYYMAKPVWLNSISVARSINDIYCRKLVEKNYKKLFCQLNDLVQKSNSTGCEYSDYLNLYKLIRTGNYRQILECGSGVSSAVIALAIKENISEGLGKSHLTSMEESEFYFKQIESISPKNLKEFVSFVCSGRQEKMLGDHLGCFYESVPDHECDFIYIDGPTDRKEWNNKNTPKCFNADVLMVRKSKNFVAVLDQRIWTLRALRALAPEFQFDYHPVGKFGMIKG